MNALISRLRKLQPRGISVCTWTDAEKAGASRAPTVVPGCWAWVSAVISHRGSFLSSLGGGGTRRYVGEATPSAAYEKVTEYAHLKFIPNDLKVKCKLQVLTKCE